MQTRSTGVARSDGAGVDGARVRSLRTGRGMSRAALAVRAGLSYATLCRIEQESGDVRSATLHALAVALGVRADDLLR